VSGVDVAQSGTWTDEKLAADSRRTVDGLQRALGGCDIVRPFPARVPVFQRTNHAEDPSTREPGTCYSENARAFFPPGIRSAFRPRRIGSANGGQLCDRCNSIEEFACRGSQQHVAVGNGNCIDNAVAYRAISQSRRRATLKHRLSFVSLETPNVVLH